MTTKQVFNTSAELNYPTVLPTLDLDFANSKTLDPRITFTRSSGGSYGGTQEVVGDTLYKNPLFAKGGTGGKAPEEAYKQLVGKEQFNTMQKDLMSTLQGRDRGSEAYMFLEKYAPDIADNAWYIADNSKQGNQFRYALQEAVFANEARSRGYDSIVGYSKGRKDKGNFLSEIFDVRENLYPSPSGEYGLTSEFEGLLSK